MRLNDTLAEVTGRPEEFGEWLYWLSIFGEPTADRPWGFQFDGHHLNLNCFVLGDQLVLSPLFLGSEPVEAESGRHAGTRVFEAEEADGFALMAAMTPEEQKAAIVGTELPGELLTAAFHDNVELGFEGISHDELSPAAREHLVALISRYVGHIRPGHAEVKMAEVREHLDETFFSWIGGTGVDDVFYYRVQSPVILIEFDHLAGIVFDNDFPTRRHIHTVVRTPNGNDYGKNLLAQHPRHTTLADPCRRGRSDDPDGHFAAGRLGDRGSRPRSTGVFNGEPIRAADPGERPGHGLEGTPVRDVQRVAQRRRPPAARSPGAQLHVGEGEGTEVAETRRVLLHDPLRRSARSGVRLVTLARTVGREVGDAVLPQVSKVTKDTSAYTTSPLLTLKRNCALDSRGSDRSHQA